ncbi:unnamed protein product [Protopolystoma xenopodis]|uniref:Uncharacterized protein n=1 Tax=Protopolystoma xenopodis TaxID=117903 RepID=A0A448WZH5_9PLAT|nr:unnamed protein product [Protopolystoma xenopodis]
MELNALATAAELMTDTRGRGPDNPHAQVNCDLQNRLVRLQDKVAEIR